MDYGEIVQDRFLTLIIWKYRSYKGHLEFKILSLQESILSW